MTESKKRKVHLPEFKAKVGLEACEDLPPHSGLVQWIFPATLGGRKQPAIERMNIDGDGKTPPNEMRKANAASEGRAGVADGETSAVKRLMFNSW